MSVETQLYLDFGDKYDEIAQAEMKRRIKALLKTLAQFDVSPECVNDVMMRVQEEVEEVALYLEE